MSQGWQNWSGLVQCPGARIARPGDIEALCRLIEHHQGPGAIRPLGSGHSFVPFWANDDTLLQMDAFSGLHDVKATADSTVARFGAGTALHAIGPLLANHGLALANMGDIDRQTLAGAISTGTHGTGRKLGSLASQVTALEIVNGKGHPQGFTTPDDVAMARVSLGLLGVITAIELCVVPAYHLHECNTVESTDACLDAFDERSNAHRHHEFWWVPRGDFAVAKTLNPIAAEGPVQLVEIPFGEAGERWGPSWQIFPSTREQRFNEMEYAVPEAAAIRCFTAVRTKILQEFPKLPWPVEYRLVAGDDGWLSPTGGEAVATISIHQGADRPPEPLFTAIEPILREHGGRPHWGKWHQLDAGNVDRLYPKAANFRTARRQLDPGAVFLTAHLAALFGYSDIE